MHDIFIEISCIFCYTELKDTLSVKIWQMPVKNAQKNSRLFRPKIATIF